MNIKNLCATCWMVLLLSGAGCKRSQIDTKNSESNGAFTEGHPIVTGTILHKVPPVYPPVAKAAGVEGTVVLHAVIAADGSVESLNAISGPPLLQGASVDAVKQWVYAPYLLNGVPTRVDTTVTVNFRFASQSK